MTPRPRSVKVGPTRWKILYLKEVEKGAAVGCTYPQEHCIRIMRSMPEQSIRATLLHELLHVIAWTYGFHPPKNDTEEAVVSLFSVPLLTLLQGNAKLTSYLLEK